MGKPAARMGDTTAHGGSIVVGNPVIMIGKMPASTLGDMHVCPMCTPAVPPIPHVGGPILLGSTGIFLGKKPAARLSDSAVCVGPPSMPAMGCMTVLIGEAGSGSQAGSAGAAAAALAAIKKGPKAIEPFPLSEPPEAPPVVHTVECKFTDSAGKPLSGVVYEIKDPDGAEILGSSTSDGMAYYGGYAKEGSFSVVVPVLSEIKWSVAKAGTKDKVKYSAKAEGVEDGRDAYVTITEETGALSRMLEFIACKVKGEKIEGEWQWKPAYLEAGAAGADKGAPVYHFQVVVGCLTGFSDPLTISDTLKVKVTDPDGKAIKDLDYELSLPNGEVVTGKVDSSGTVTRANVPPGKHKLKLVDPKKAKKPVPAQEAKAKPKYSGFGGTSEAEGQQDAGGAAEAPVADEPHFEGFIYYDPKNSEYLLLETEEKFKAFSTSVEKSHALRGKTTAAWKEANPGKRAEELEKLRKKWSELFEGEAVGKSDDGLEELLLIKSNSQWGKTTAFVHIPSAWRNNGKFIPGRWAKHSDRALQKALDEVLKKEPEKGPLDAKLKWKLFQSEPVAGGVWPWAPPAKKNFKGEIFEFSSEAALGRYVAGYQGEVEYAPLEGKIAMKISGEASFALTEGKISGKWHIPTRRGIDLLSLLCGGKAKNACMDTNRECCLRITIAAEGSVFTGVSVMGALSFPAIDLSKDVEKRKVGAEAEAGGLVGFQAKGSFKLVPEWSPEAEGEFKSLGEYGVEGGVTAGLAAGISFKINYERGRFHVHFAASAALGFGGKGSVKLELDMKEGVALINHLLHSVDYHYVTELTEQAFTAYKDYTFALIAESEAVLSQGAEFAMASVHNFGHWLAKQAAAAAPVKQRIAGASLRQVMYRNLPPEALGQTILTVMLVREESDFEIILDILRAAESRNELEWVLRTVSQNTIDAKVPSVYEKQKQSALEAGIKRIEEFGMAVGIQKEDRYTDPRNDFLKDFHRILLKKP